MRRTQSKGQRTTRSVAVTLLGLWLFVALLAAVPQLHRALHADSDSPTHHCVVEKLTGGGILYGPVTDVHVDPVREAFAAAPVNDVLVFSSDLRLAPGRGPPISSTYLQVAG